MNKFVVVSLGFGTLKIFLSKKKGLSAIARIITNANIYLYCQYLFTQSLDAVGTIIIASPILIGKSHFKGNCARQL